MLKKSTKTSIKAAVLLSTFSLAAIPAAIAGNNGNSNTNQGSTPNGKPFVHINEQIAAHSAAIEGLQSQLDTVNSEIAVINTRIAELESNVSSNRQLIESLQASLDQTNQNLAQLRSELTAEITAMQTRIDSLQTELTGLQTQINQLTANLALELAALKQAITDNATNIGTLSVQVASMTAELLLLNTGFDNHEARLTALESAVIELQTAVAGLDVRLISVEAMAHTHTQANCAAILAQNPAAQSGTYEIDPDGNEEGAPFSVYCDMTHNGGGWTNLDFTNNKVMLANDNYVQCSSLTSDDNSITCQQPLFNNGGYMYHYYCNGSDTSANYMVDHIAVILGHNNATELGFSGLSQRHTGSHGTSTSSQDEYLYIDGNLVSWRDAVAHQYSNNMNGNCVPGFFTLSR